MFSQATMNLIKINEREQSPFFKSLFRHSVTYDIQKIGFLMFASYRPKFDLFPCFTSHARVARADWWENASYALSRNKDVIFYHVTFRTRRCEVKSCSPP